MLHFKINHSLYSKLLFLLFIINLFLINELLFIFLFLLLLVFVIYSLNYFKY